jgi:CRP-like cAMP-binding protein
VFSQRALDLLRSAGEVLHPEPGELLWDTGDTYDLYLVLAGGVLLLDRRDDRVVFVVEEGDFVGELGMLMGQRAFLPGVAMEDTAVLRVRVEELRRLVEISGELSDVLLSAFDARRRLLRTMGEGGLVLAGDDDRDLHRLQEFAERNQRCLLALPADSAGHGLALRPVRQRDLGGRDRGGKAAEPRTASHEPAVRYTRYHPYIDGAASVVQVGEEARLELVPAQEHAVLLRGRAAGDTPGRPLADFSRPGERATA